MPEQRSSSPHFQIEDLGASLRFTFLYRKYWLEIAVLSIVLAIGLSGTVYYVGVLLAGQALIPFTNFSVVLLLNLLIVLVVAVVCLTELLWQLVGREVVEISAEEVVMRHRIFGLGPSRRHEARNISGVFVSQRKYAGVGWLRFQREMRFLSFKRGRIALNNGKTIWGGVRTYRFGSILGEAEAREIVALIHERFPQYQYRSVS